MLNCLPSSLYWWVVTCCWCLMQHANAKLSKAWMQSMLLLFTAWFVVLVNSAASVSDDACCFCFNVVQDHHFALHRWCHT